MAPVILAIDPGRTVGVCWGCPGGLVTMDSWHLGVDQRTIGEMGAVADLFGRHLREAIKEARPDLVVFEAPFSHSGFIHPSDVRLLHGQCWAIEELCAQQKLRCVEATIPAVRADVVPKGVRKPQKADAQRAVKARGLRPTTPHEADAAAVWLHMIFTLDDVERGARGWRNLYQHP